MQRRSVAFTYMCTHVRMYCYICTYVHMHTLHTRARFRYASPFNIHKYTDTHVHTYIRTYIHTHTHLDLKELEVLVRRGRWEYPHQLSTPPHLQCTPYTSGEERCMEMDETWSQEMEQNGSDTTLRMAPFCT